MNALTIETFADWSRGLRRSDRRAYTQVFEATYDTLYRYAWYITRQDEAAYDVLQDVYLRLWRIRERIDPDRSLKALLHQMVRNAALNHVRHVKRARAVALNSVEHEPAVEAVAEAEYDAQLLQERMRGWIEEMPARRREAFMLSRYQGLRHAEIADIMQLAPKTVNNHIVLALAHLRGRLRVFASDPVTR